MHGTNSGAPFNTIVWWCTVIVKKVLRDIQHVEFSSMHIHEYTYITGMNTLRKFSVPRSLIMRIRTQILSVVIALQVRIQILSVVIKTWRIFGKSTNIPFDMFTTMLFNTTGSSHIIDDFSRSVSSCQSSIPSVGSGVGYIWAAHENFAMQIRLLTTSIYGNSYHQRELPTGCRWEFCHAH